eukprot:1205885-Alexandrium_andersonii.AAC.1
MHKCFGRSELELRGPMNGRSIDPRSSRWGALCAIIRARSESDSERGSPGGSEGVPKGVVQRSGKNDYSGWVHES